jgi:hypothetical protein
MEEWKSILCDSEKCMSEMFVPENMKISNNSLTEEAIEKYKIYPEIDNELLTQFRCERCGKITTWGVTRRKIAKQLYERYQRV